MTGSIGSRFAAAAPLLTDGLLDDDGLAAIRDVADDLPAALSPIYVIESRLGHAARAADFAFYVDDRSGGHHTLAGRVPGSTIGPGLLRDPDWQRIVAFATAWSDGAPELQRLVCWLEFDTAGPIARRHRASVFFQPGLGRTTSIEGRPPGHSRPWDRATLDPVLAHFPLPPGATDTLHRVMAALPPPAAVEIVGLMFPRDPVTIRLTISPLSAATLRGCLRAIGWVGHGPDFDAFVRLLPAAARYLRLNIDVAEALGPRISVECIWTCSPTAFQADPGWRAFLDHLMARGLAREDKCAAVLRRVPPLTAGAVGSWPDDLAAMASIIGSARRSTLWRYPSHLKLAYQAGVPIEAKAYFSLVHVWARRSV